MSRDARHFCHGRLSLLGLSLLASLLPGSALAVDPWAEKAYVYLNFESKITDANGQLFLGVEFVSNQAAGQEDPFDPTHFDPWDVQQDPDYPADPDAKRPHWLEPPDDEEPQDGSADDPVDDDVEITEGFPKLSQPAFSSRVFDPLLARRDYINAITAQSQSNLNFLHLDLVRLFDPVTFRPNAAALARRDFKFMQYRQVGGVWHWALVPNLGDGDANRKKVYLADIGGQRNGLHGVAIVTNPAGPRGLAAVLRHRAVIYVWSNEQARGCAAACNVAAAQRAVGHVLTHEAGHILGLNKPLPPLNPNPPPPSLWYQDNSGHWLCAAVEARNGRAGPVFEPNILSHGQCVTVGGMRANVYPIEPLDKATLIRNVGPRCPLVRQLARGVNRLLKPPANRNRNHDIMPMVAALCALQASGVYYTDAIRESAVIELLSLLDAPGPVSESQLQATLAALDAIVEELAHDGISDAACNTASLADDFEAPETVASPAGVPLPLQNGWYQPTPGSADFSVFPHDGDLYAFAADPGGADQFIAARCPGGGVAARAQHDVDFSTAPHWLLSFDFACKFDGLTRTHNIASFSLQPTGTARTLTILNTYTGAPATATTWSSGCLAFDAAGVQAAAPGLFAGPAWQNLPFDTWFRQTTEIDLTENRVARVTIRNLHTGAFATAEPIGWYLAGGSSPALPNPTAIRLFAGGTEPGNLCAWDNVSAASLCARIPSCPGERGDANCDGAVDFFDIDPFLLALFDSSQYAATLCGGDFCAVDVDCSGTVDFFDIDPFLACLFTLCPPCP